MYKLIDADNQTVSSDTPGTFGGHRGLKIYGRLDCPSALRHIARGHYVKHRVFFADEQTAVHAGYRPCGVCMRDKHAAWKAGK
jgi:methylphosphotriester-DNA--protein-cysteine methyltransferase